MLGFGVQANTTPRPGGGWDGCQGLGLRSRLNTHRFGYTDLPLSTLTLLVSSPSHGVTGSCHQAQYDYLGIRDGELRSSCLCVRLIHFCSHLSSILKADFLSLWLLLKTKKHRTFLDLLQTSRTLEFLHNVSSHDIMGLGIIPMHRVLLSKLCAVLLSRGL